MTQSAVLTLTVSVRVGWRPWTRTARSPWPGSAHHVRTGRTDRRAVSTQRRARAAEVGVGVGSRALSMCRSVRSWGPWWQCRSTSNKICQLSATFPRAAATVRCTEDLPLLQSGPNIVAPPTHRRSLRSRRTALISAAAVAAAGLGAIPFVTQANAAPDLVHQPARQGRLGGERHGYDRRLGGRRRAHVFTVSTRASWSKALGSSARTPRRGSSRSRARSTRTPMTRASYLRRLRLRYRHSPRRLSQGVRPGDLGPFQGALRHAGVGPRRRKGQAGEEHRLHGAVQHHHRGRPGH